MAKIPSKKMSLSASEWKALMADPFKNGDRIFTDAEEKGLELRIIGKKAAWITRYKQLTRTIGYAVAPEGEARMLTTPKEARTVHNTVKSLIDINRERVEYFLSNYYFHSDPKKRDVFRSVELSENEYMNRWKAKAITVNLKKAWTLQQCVDNYLEKRTDGKSKEQMKPSSVADFKTTFARPEVKPFLQRLVVDFSPEIPEPLRD